MNARTFAPLAVAFWSFAALHLAAAQVASPAPPASAPNSPTTLGATTASADLEEVVVNGIKRGDLIMPTTVTSDSAYGLDLSVMDTPRNNTVLSKAQIDALDVQNPAGFSYLTSSAYSDASFGQPNVPRIRGQYADMFYNGMRDSFTLNGYGAPISFNMVDTIDIVKGPASVQGGAGAGVGGSIVINTKMPSLTRSAVMFDLEGDSHQKRIAAFDVAGPLSSDTAGRVSFTSNDSGSYYYDMFFHQQSLYAVVVTNFTPNYTVSLNGDITDTRYKENDGVNRVTQGLINNGTYLTGAPPLSDVFGYGTGVDLTGSTKLNDRITIDETPGTGAHALHGMLQLIQTYRVNDNFSIVNNTFYDYLNRYNHTMDYYGDTAIGSYSFENKTDLKLKFATGVVQQDIDAGFTYRYAHVLDIQDEANEPVSVFDLSQDPGSWVFPASAQIFGGAIPYTAAFGHVQYGVPGSNSFYPGNTIDSNLQDGAFFLEHRLKFSPLWALLYGARGDLVQLNDSDPLYEQGVAAGLGPTGNVCLGSGGFVCDSLPQSQHTSWYGLYNGNASLVYSPTSWLSGYLTYNRAQYVLANANDGAVGALGYDATVLLRQGTLLEEAGLKFDLLDKALFVSIAGFNQERAIPVGQGGRQHSWAHITGAEFETNYQPGPRFFATASYSYLHTTLDSPSDFWNFPAYQGLNYDGAATNIVWSPHQRFVDPGVPEHLFNLLVNYRLGAGLGFQSNLQVTGPVQTTQAGYISIAETEAALAGQGMTLPPNLINSATGYYLPPTIPWQFTLNASVFYNFRQHYTVKFEVYNLTDERNLLNNDGYYGNDFLTRLAPRSYDVTFTGKF